MRIPLPSPRNNIRLSLDHKTNTLHITGVPSPGLANDAEPEDTAAALNSLRELLTSKLEGSDLDTAMELVNAISGVTGDTENSGAGRTTEGVDFEDSRRSNPLNSFPNTGSPRAATRDNPAMDAAMKKLKASQDAYAGLVRRFPAAARARRIGG